jgi:hypothetical protein
MNRKKLSNNEDQPVIIIGHTIPDDASNEENPSEGARDYIESPCKEQISYETAEILLVKVVD